MVCYFLNTTKPGSPPLVRERLLELAIGCANHGITPARAGKTASTITTETDGGDHPRSCGKDKPLPAPG